MASGEIFKDENGEPRILYACSIASGSARLIELAARLGFDAIWIEMEHASYDLAEAEHMCLAAEVGGAVPLIRTPGTDRDHILQALEVGGKLIVVPMVNDAATAAEIVKWGKFRPLGQRGFNGASRGLHFGLNDTETMLAQANEETFLIPQIETTEAVSNIQEIVAVKGLDGIFIGPGDLSSDMGMAGQFENHELIDTVVGCIAAAKDRGLHAGVFAGEGPLFEASRDAGADLFIAVSDQQTLQTAWKADLIRLKGS